MSGFVIGRKCVYLIKKNIYLECSLTVYIDDCEFVCRKTNPQEGISCYTIDIFASKSR